MRHGTICTVLPDRDGEGMPSPYQTIGATVGRGHAPAGGFAEQNHIAHCGGDGSLRHG